MVANHRGKTGNSGWADHVHRACTISGLKGAAGLEEERESQDRSRPVKTHTQKKKGEKKRWPCPKEGMEKKGVWQNEAGRPTKKKKRREKARETDWASPSGKSKKNEAKQRPKTREREARRKSTPVSYTHLTLPTKRIV